MLGDFGSLSLTRDYQGFPENQQNWIFIENLIAVILFFGATFLTQITVLNMLIQIMSETHSRHNERVKELTRRQMLKLQVSFATQNSYIQKCCRKRVMRALCLPLCPYQGHWDYVPDNPDDHLMIIIAANEEEMDLADDDHQAN